MSEYEDLSLVSLPLSISLFSVSRGAVWFGVAVDSPESGQFQFKEAAGHRNLLTKHPRPPGECSLLIYFILFLLKESWCLY